MIEAFLWRRRLAEMRSLLAADRRLLLRGAIAELARNDARRAEIEARLRGLPEDVARREEPFLAEIRALAKRNERLLSAYLDGARRAAARLAEIARSEEGFGAYRRDGSKFAPQARSPSRNIRA